MNKRAILLILFTLLTLFQAHAVLKEQDLESTLSILRTELTNYHAELERQSGYEKSTGGYQRQAVQHHGAK